MACIEDRNTGASSSVVYATRRAAGVSRWLGARRQSSIRDVVPGLKPQYTRFFGGNDRHLVGQRLQLHRPIVQPHRAVRRRTRPACASSSSHRRAPDNRRARARRGFRAAPRRRPSWSSRCPSGSAAPAPPSGRCSRSGCGPTPTCPPARARPAASSPTPSASVLLLRNTAAWACIVRCMSSRRSATRVPPLAWRARSKRSSDCLAGLRRQRRLAGVRPDRARRPACAAARPNTTMSSSELHAQPVGAMHRHAGAFAHRHQPGRHRIRIVARRPQHLAVIVRRHAAHVVVHGRQHRDRLLRHVDAGEHFARSRKCPAAARAADRRRDAPDAA